jgi:hypothetical protein
MNRKRTLVTLTATFALALAAPAAQSGSGPTYALEGTYATTATSLVCVPDLPGDCPAPTYAYDGTATCVSKCENAAQMGSFTLDLSGEGNFPPSPCVSKRVEGTLTFFPPHPIFPAIVVAVEGHDVDFHGYRVQGTITTGALAGLSVTAFVSYPPGPISPMELGCSPGAFDGTLVIPPNPV